MKWLIALAAGIAGYCYYRGLALRQAARRPEEITRWEGEGGNVPSVATPAPRPYPAGDTAVRH
jgi:hypothetical protein